MAKRRVTELWSELDEAVTFEHHSISGSHLELATVTSIAALIVGITNLLLAVERRADARAWTLDSVKTLIRSKAAEYLGSDRVTELRFDGLAEFLASDSEQCIIHAEVEDEVYSFVVNRRKDVVIIKWLDGILPPT
jgi:hypothetical protein